jgi:DNA-binding MltR family transcriptional regulator
MQVRTFRRTLTKETDRGVALVCAAYLDEELKTLLEKSFVEAPQIVSKLLTGTGPLSTFSSRIDLAFLTGLLPEEYRRALHLVRKVRNDFAHQHQERSFTDADIAARCRELLSLNPFTDETNLRRLFIRAVIAVLVEIHVKTDEVTGAEVAPPNPVEPMRPSLAQVRNVLDSVFANLTDEQKSRIENPETREEELSRIQREVLLRSEGSVTNDAE